MDRTKDEAEARSIESSRNAAADSPPPWQNERATGARKLELRPDLKSPDILDTGDPVDEPQLPYGLTEPVDEPPHSEGQDRGTGTPRRDEETTPGPTERR